MQKKIIALAVASLASGAALAQTNVTIYGIADAAYVYSSGGSNNILNTNNGNKTFSGVQSGVLGGSRIGFRGTEALGNGLNAIFTLEYSLTIDDNTGVGTSNGNGGLNARQQFVGLQSDKLGTVALGRQYAPGYVATVNNDVLAGSSLGSQSILSSQAGNTITPNSAARWNNAATYTSPNWSGFTAKAIYAFGESETLAADGKDSNANLRVYDSNLSSTDNGRFGIGGNYSNGALNIDLVYQQRYSVVPTADSAMAVPNLWGDDINEGYIGGSYDFKAAKVAASYQQQNDKNFANNDNTVWSLGVKVPVMAASNILLTYAQLEMDAGPRDARVDGKSNTATLAWTTAMSKRTTLYAGYVRVDNDKKSLPIRFTGVPAGVGQVNETNNTFAAGVNHTF